MQVFVDTVSLASTAYLLRTHFGKRIESVHYFAKGRLSGRVYLFLLRRLLRCDTVAVTYDISTEKDRQGRQVIYAVEAVIQDALVAMRQDRALDMPLLHKNPYAAYPGPWLERCLEHTFLPVVYGFVTAYCIAGNRTPDTRPGETAFCHAYHPLHDVLRAYFPSRGMPYHAYGRWTFPARLLAGLARTAASYLVLGVMAGIGAPKAAPDATGSGRVGVQYCWGADPSRRSDIYWQAGSGIEPGRILFYFDRPDLPLTPRLATALAARGYGCVRRRKAQSGLLGACAARLRRRRPTRNASDHDWRNTGRFPRELFRHFVQAWRAFLGAFPAKNHLLSGYLFNQLLFAFIFVLNWKDFFADNNIVINCNHSGDVGLNHITQSLAMEAWGGINIRSTYSFFSITHAAWSREFHAYFLWGKMAKCDNTIEHLYNKNTLISGYLFDNLFNQTAITDDQAAFIRSGRTIAVFDEVYGGWNIFSKASIADFYTQVALAALRHDDVRLVIKPKWYSTGEIAALSPAFLEAMRKGKVHCVTGESPYKACVGAELAVCAGINSAGFEAALFGLPVLFLVVDATPCRLLEDGDAPRCVYRDGQAFGLAIDRHLAAAPPGRTLRLPAAVLDRVDPYRDGQAGERIGLFMHDFLAARDGGTMADQALTAAVAAFSRRFGSDKVVLAAPGQ